MKTIPNYSQYRISEDGTILKNSGLKIRPCVSSGYLATKLQDDSGVGHTVLVHRAVAETYLGPIGRGMWVNHKDGNKLNNHVSNLEIGTPSQNHIHARDVLKRSYITSESAAYTKLNAEAVEAICDLAEMGWSQHKMSKAFLVSQPTISNILNGKTWGDGARSEIKAISIPNTDI